MTEGAASPWRRAPLLAAAAFLLLALPGLGTLPLYDPDEAYYPATARESLEAGNPLDLRLNGGPRWEKPPLAYGLQAVAFSVAGPSEAAARFPSVLAAALLVWVVGAATARAAGARAGGIAAAVLGTGLGTGILGRAAHPEILLVLGWTSAAMLAALAASLPLPDRPRRWPLAAAVALAAGFLAKGPLALLFPGLMLVAAAAVARGERGGFAPAARGLAGAALGALALSAPWFLWMAGRHGSPFLETVLAQLGHATSAEFEHAHSHPLYFVAVLPVAFLPWIGLLPEALRGLSRADASPRSRFSLLMACAAGSALLWFSASRARLPHYALSLLPPLAALAGMRLDALLDGPPGMARRALAPCAALLAGLCIALACGAPLLPAGVAERAGGAAAVTTAGVTVAAVVAASGGAAGLALRRRGEGVATLGGVAVGAALLLPAAIPAAAPLDRALRPPLREWGARIRSGDPGGDGAVAVYRKRLPSLSFYAGRPVVRIPDDDDAAATWAAASAPRRFLVGHGAHRPALTTRIPALRGVPRSPSAVPAGVGGTPPTAAWGRTSVGEWDLWESPPPGGAESRDPPARERVPPAAEPR